MAQGTHATATRLLTDHLLGGRLDEFVATRRDAGVSWRRIALAIRDETGIDVTGVTLANWFANRRPVYPADIQRARPSA